MKRAVIIHGMPSSEDYHNPNRDSQSNSHWLPWLQQQLCARDILAQTPEMPRPYTPDYDVWSKEFERQAIDEKTILVGHSFGGGCLLRWLTEHPQVTICKLILVAPWLDREREYEGLFDFTLAPDIAQRTLQGIDYIYSSNDRPAMQQTLEYVRDAVPTGVQYHDFPDYRHFTYKHMQTRAFPELLEFCLAV